MEKLIQRHPQNPILERDTYVGYDTLFNPGALRVDDKIVLTVRAARDHRFLAGINPRGTIYTNQVCDHILFESVDDGKNFIFTGRKITGSSATWIDGFTQTLATPTYYGPYGTEDLRLCQLGEKYVGVVHVMTHEAYRGDHKAGGRIGLVVTEDFKHFTRWIVGPQREETDRDAWIVKQKDKIAFIHRIKPDESGARKMKRPSIQVAFFNDLKGLIQASPAYWKEHLDHIDNHIILKPVLDWEIKRVGAGPIIEHEAGYVMFYHGVDKNFVYSTGAALLDKTTFQSIARLDQPLLKPETWYERGDFGGDVKNVTFVGGAICCQDDPKRIQLYYGASDSHVARADILNLDQLIEVILRSPIKGVDGNDN